MLTISKEQHEAFQSGTLAAFEREMAAHCKVFSPRLSSVLGDEQLRVVVRSSIRRAAGHGFNYRGTVRLFLELGFLFGSSFDVDVQYPWARRHLGQPDPGTQVLRADALHAASTRALADIHGPGNSHTYAALRRLESLAAAPPRPGAHGFTDVVLAEMRRVHPQKYAHVGEQSLRGILAFAETEAMRHRLAEPHEVLLLSVLMFCFGQGCTDDPLYPWISRTLANERVSSPSARARQLQRKALTWLRHVLARERKDS